MESIDFDIQFPSVHTWVRLQLTEQTPYFSAVFIICIAIVHRSLSLQPGQANSDAAQTRSKRPFPALKSLQSRKLSHLHNKDFSSYMKKYEMEHNHSRQRQTFIFKLVMKNLQILEQVPNSRLLEFIKGVLYVIPQVVKLLSLLQLNAELVINMQMKREVDTSFQFTSFSPCCHCFAQNNQIPYVFQE